MSLSCELPRSHHLTAPVISPEMTTFTKVGGPEVILRHHVIAHPAIDVVEYSIAIMTLANVYI